MPSYIYAIKSNKHIYIGSSYNYKDRFKRHKKRYEKYKEGKSYKKIMVYEIFDLYGIDNCIIEIIKEFDSRLSLDELRKIEGEIQQEYMNNDNFICVNKKVAGGKIKSKKIINPMSYIYIIKPKNGKHVYIGSSYNYKKRFKRHKFDYEKYKEGKSHKLMVYDIFDLYGINNCIIEVLKEIKGKIPLDELHKIEGEIQREYRNNDNYICVNKHIAGRSSKQYREENKDIIKERYRKYYQQNKDIVNEKSRIYQEKNKDKIKERKRIYREKNKDIIKEKVRKYREKNKDIIKEKRRIYREKNKDKINEKKKVKSNCPHCKKVMRKDCIKRHIKNSCKKIDCNFSKNTET